MTPFAAAACRWVLGSFSPRPMRFSSRPVAVGGLLWLLEGLYRGAATAVVILARPFHWLCSGCRLGLRTLHSRSHGLAVTKILVLRCAWLPCLLRKRVHVSI